MLIGSDSTMPSLLDAADAFSKLGEKSVKINEAACVCVRHRNATCHACLQVCPHEAITIERNTLAVDQHLCTGCGACASVCPTEALRLAEDPNETVRALIDAAEPNSTINVCCKHVSEQLAEHEQDPDRSLLQPSANEPIAAVRCLASLDESSLIHGACAGIALHYHSADCAQCPEGHGILIEDIIEQARSFTDALPLASQTHFDETLDRFRWTVQGEPAAKQPRDTSPEMSRRGMFDHLIARTTDSVAEAAVGTFYVSKHSSDEKPTLAQNLMEAQGVMKTVTVERSAQVLDDLYRMDPAHAEDPAFAQDETVLPTRLFGEITLDTTRCDLCGICMTFCPTRALTGIASEPTNPFVALTRSVEVTGELSFRANDCVACQLCVDICPQKALDLALGIKTCDLFALEPRLLLKK